MLKIENFEPTSRQTYVGVGVGDESLAFPLHRVDVATVGASKTILHFGFYFDFGC